MKEFIKEYGTLILAVYGIVQVWFIALWMRYIHKAKIKIYETGTIEIGYSAFGPTIGLTGTLRALNKKIFVKSIDLLIIREKDKAQHTLKWVAFRPPTIDLTGSQPISMEIPCSFLISPDSPHKYNIIFNDERLFEDIRPLFYVYMTEWYKVAEQLSKIWTPTLGATPTSEIINQQVALIESFKKTPIRIETYAAFDRMCYWEPGTYRLTVNVQTSKPDKAFTETYSFSINDVDSRNLKLNVVTILNEPISNYLRVQNFPYYFAYSVYT